MKLLFATLLVSLAYSNKLERRIVDGYRTSAKSWMVYLKHPVTFCGGVLYTNYAIITAAHCSDIYPDGWEAQLNQYNIVKTSRQEGGSTHPVVEIVKHPYYNKADYSCDVAVWRTDDNSADRTIVDLDDGTEIGNKNLFVYAIGWGWIQRMALVDINSNYSPGEASQYLKETKLSLADDRKCLAKTIKFMNPEINICTGNDYSGPSSCYGDSGGPIFRKRNGRIILMGIISTVSSCGFNEFYNIHVKISNPEIANFINAQARNFVSRIENSNYRNPKTTRFGSYPSHNNYINPVASGFGSSPSYNYQHLKTTRFGSSPSYNNHHIPGTSRYYPSPSQDNHPPNTFHPNHFSGRFNHFTFNPTPTPNPHPNPGPYQMPTRNFQTGNLPNFAQLHRNIFNNFYNQFPMNFPNFY